MLVVVLEQGVKLLLLLPPLLLADLIPAKKEMQQTSATLRNRCCRHNCDMHTLVLAMPSRFKIINYTQCGTFLCTRTLFAPAIDCCRLAPPPVTHPALLLPLLFVLPIPMWLLSCPVVLLQVLPRPINFLLPMLLVNSCICMPANGCAPPLLLAAAAASAAFWIVSISLLSKAPPTEAPLPPLLRDLTTPEAAILLRLDMRAAAAAGVMSEPLSSLTRPVSSSPTFL